MAAGKKTGGRKRGTPNRATAAKAAEIAATGLTPLDYMLTILRDEGQGQEARFEAAKAAAPYAHPRLNAIDADIIGRLNVNVKGALAWHQPT